MTVAFVSLGCPKNLVDSEKMLGLLAEQGIAPTPEPADADVIVINTCGFLEAAKRESLDAIAAAARMKRAGGRTRRIVVAGCLATRMGREILDHVPDVDAIVGVAQRDDIVAAVRGTQIDGEMGRRGDGEKRRSVSMSPRRPVPVSPRRFFPSDTARLRLTPRHYAYLRISEGCNRGCSFCTIPSIRGPLRSKPIGQIVAEARELIADGALELNLIGQDTTSYGSDLGAAAPRLPALLRRLDRLPGVHWLRLLYAYPSDFSDEIIEAIAGSRHVLPYIDLPLQHINDRILGLMRRRVTRARTESLLEKLRARIPGVTLRTTFITGFPGETDAEHRELLRFVEDFGFDMLGVFSYSLEASTAAGRRTDQIPEPVMQARRDELMAAQQQVVHRRNAGLIGETATLLIDRAVGDSLFVGRTVRQAPEVDSVTALRATPGRTLRPGQLLPVRISGYRGYDLVAEPAGECLAETRQLPGDLMPIYQPMGGS
ncbi:MAG: 30S ribosomal protein S12 methylthiotransferase RimO [Phycisphaerae bacterium]|nr:30S ribosomal protein S12 methylthiotransferase RimO [Phycisphaerae bacterium]